MNRNPIPAVLRRWLLPWAVLVALALACGLAGNALRGSGHLALDRQWFGSPAGDDPLAATHRESGPTQVPLWRPPHEFRALDVEQTRALASDALQRPGRVLVLDAREAEHYRAGHLPGAVNLPYFGLPGAAEPLLPLLQGVRWLVVYCESVTCDDGIFLCRALSGEFGIPSESIALFDGGVAAWRAAGLPLYAGDHPHLLR